MPYRWFTLVYSSKQCQINKYSNFQSVNRVNCSSNSSLKPRSWDTIHHHDRFIILQALIHCITQLLPIEVIKQLANLNSLLLRVRLMWFRLALVKVSGTKNYCIFLGHWQFDRTKKFWNTKTWMNCWKPRCGLEACDTCQICPGPPVSAF